MHGKPGRGGEGGKCGLRVEEGPAKRSHRAGKMKGGMGFPLRYWLVVGEVMRVIACTSLWVGLGVLLMSLLVVFSYSWLSGTCNKARSSGSTFLEHMSVW